MGRKPIDRDAIRERVLDEAETSIRHHGLLRSSMSDLVEASGVSRRTFYKVFRSRDEVLKGIVDRKMSTIIGRLTLLADEDMSAMRKLEKLLGLVRGLTTFITPGLMREVAASHPAVWRYINQRRLKGIAIWKQIVEEGQRKGEIREDLDPEVFMLILQTVAEHMVNPVFMTEHGLTLTQVLDQAQMIILYGIATREEEPARRGGGGEEVQP